MSAVTVFFFTGCVAIRTLKTVRLIARKRGWLAVFNPGLCFAQSFFYCSFKYDAFALPASRLKGVKTKARSQNSASVCDGWVRGGE